MSKSLTNALVLHGINRRGNRFEPLGHVKICKQSFKMANKVNGALVDVTALICGVNYFKELNILTASVFIEISIF